GGPNSVYDAGAPQVPDWVLTRGVPILGVCYGIQALAFKLAGPDAVKRGAHGGEYGHQVIERVAPAAGPGGAAAGYSKESPLWKGVPATTSVWMSHGDRVEKVPTGFQLTARSGPSPITGFDDPARRIFGIQFHPEVTHTQEG